MRILIAEDDKNMSKILKLYLQKEGYTVNVTFDGEETLSYLEKNQVDLLLLDWMLPHKNGIEICKEIKALNIPLKIIMITARTTTDDELLGLTAGADDYIRKPFDMNVLLLRIKKLCKLEQELKYKELTLNPETHEVIQDGAALVLTKKEYELLTYFMSNQKIVLTREQILNHVWGNDYFGDIRTVDTHIRRLRKKLGDSYIQTKFGTGYIMGENNE